MVEKVRASRGAWPFRLRSQQHQRNNGASALSSSGPSSAEERVVAVGDGDEINIHQPPPFGGVLAAGHHHIGFRPRCALVIQVLSSTGEPGPGSADSAAETGVKSRNSTLARKILSTTRSRAAGPRPVAQSGGVRLGRRRSAPQRLDLIQQNACQPASAPPAGRTAPAAPRLSAPAAARGYLPMTDCDWSPPLWQSSPRYSSNAHCSRVVLCIINLKFECI